MREISGDVGENRDRLVVVHQAAGHRACLYREHRPRAWHELRRTGLPFSPASPKAEEFSTLVHELAHEMLHKAERRTATTKVVRETEAEAIAFVIGKAVGLKPEPHPPTTSSCITATLRFWPRAWKSSSRPPPSSLPHWSRPRDRDDARCRTGEGGVMQTILQILKKAGGWHHGLYLKIENPPYMALVIEATDESGPMRTSCHLCRSLRRTERRPHARPGDVFRAWKPCGRRTP